MALSCIILTTVVSKITATLKYVSGSTQGHENLYHSTVCGFLLTFKSNFVHKIHSNNSNISAIYRQQLKTVL